MISIAQQLLNTALSLLLLVQGNPNVDYSTQQYAIQTANSAISYANQVLAQGGNYNPYNPYNPYEPNQGTVTQIKVPFIAQYKSGYGQSQLGCGDMVVYSIRYISPTTMPLNAAYRELFSIKENWVQDSNLRDYWWNSSNYSGYYYDNNYGNNNYCVQYGNYNSSYYCAQPYGAGVYNPVSKLSNLKFDRATIENGTAHVYLKGDFSGVTESCDTKRYSAQIEAVAKQFSSVYNVQIHLSQ